MHNRGLCVGKTVTSRHRGSAVGARRGPNKVQPEQHRNQPKNPPRSLLNPFKVKVLPLCSQTCLGTMFTDQNSDATLASANMLNGLFGSCFCQYKYEEGFDAGI